MSDDGHPKPSSNRPTRALASESFPHMNTVWEPGTVPGSTHDVGVDGVERLHDEGVRKGALDLLSEAVGVAHAEGRWHAGREVERVGHVDEQHAGEVLGAHRVESFERGSPGCGVHHDLRVAGRVGERSLAGGASGLCRPCDGLLVAGPTCTHRDLVAQTCQPACKGVTHYARPEHTDSHRLLLSTPLL
jgi:hypothetical protein